LQRIDARYPSRKVLSAVDVDIDEEAELGKGMTLFA